MTNDHPAGRLRDALESFTAGDIGPMTRLLSDDVAYNLPGRHLGGGVLRGREPLFERLASAARWLDAPPKIELIECRSVGAFAVSFERFTARRGTDALDQAVCVVWRFAGDRCVEIWAHFADQPACDRFWRGFPAA